MKVSSNPIEDYISGFPKETQELLKQMNTAIKEIVPSAEETINYAIPTYKLNGQKLVYFAGYKNHIGFYATPTGHEAFKDELSKYKQGKGSVQFSLNKPLPIDLILRIVKFRMQENLDK